MAGNGIALNDFSGIVSDVAKEQLPEGDALVEAIRGYQYVLQHTFDGVEILDAREYASVPSDLIELRAFDEAGELHVLVTGEGTAGRVRTDGKGVPATVFDEEHRLWGSRLEQGPGGAYALTEGRGMRVRLPRRLVRELGGSPSVTLRVRNYLDDETVDAESGDTRFAFSDFRLVGFYERTGE